MYRLYGISQKRYNIIINEAEQKSRRRNYNHILSPEQIRSVYFLEAHDARAFLLGMDDIQGAPWKNGEELLKYIDGHDEKQVVQVVTYNPAVVFIVHTLGGYISLHASLSIQNFRDFVLGQPEGAKGIQEALAALDVIALNMGREN